MHRRPIGEQTEPMRGPITSVITVSVIGQDLTVKNTTRNQGQTSGDATSLQGPSLEGRAAAQVTSQGPPGQEKKRNQGRPQGCDKHSRANK